MLKKYILSFAELAKDKIDLVGGKGANLGELVRANFPVPDGFCINVEAYKRLVINLQEDINKILASIDWEKPTVIEEKSLQIRELIMKEEIPGEIAKEIIEGYSQIMGADQPGWALVAIRSSATAEDLPEASFAGQQETYLNIQGKKEVLEHVKGCWASLWTTRAMAYRHKQNYDHNMVFLSVVIQLMVEADIAGVAFSVNPLNGKEDEILITSAYGLGEVVVSGTVTPDTFILGKRTLAVLSKELGTKEKQLVGGSEGSTKLLDVPVERSQKFSLSDNQLKELGEIVCRVEEHYHCPQDIEWAFYNTKLYLLQSRPITTLNSCFNQEENLITGKLSKLQKFMMDDLLEHYPEAPTSLDYAVVLMSYQALLDWGTKLGLKGPKADEIISLSKEGVISLQPPKIRPSLKLLLLPLTLLRSKKSNSVQWQENQRQISAAVNQIMNEDLIKEASPYLVAQFNELFRLAEIACNLRFFYIMVANLLPMAVLSLVLNLFSPKNRRPALTDLLTVGLDYKTAVIDREINRLAVTANSVEQIKTVVMEKCPEEVDDLINKLSGFPEGQEFLSQWVTFLNINGYRTEKMYQPFVSQSWIEDPGRFLVILKAALKDPQLLERESKEIKRKKEHQTWMKNFLEKLKGPFKGLFERNYNSLRENHLIREDTLFALEMLFTAGRKIAQEFGQRLANQGFLQVPTDIVFLNKDEISRVLYHQLAREECLKLVSVRKKHYSINKTLWRNSLIKTSEHKHDGGVIKGLAGSPGLIEGPVRVINNVKDFDKLRKGEILVCPYTDPTWTPLFGLAAAVAADTGGPLSHAAIVAREYGIPAVLGTKVGTSFFKDGDTVVVNGSAGLVYKKE